MKKTFSIFAILAIIAASIFAAPPANVTTDGAGGPLLNNFSTGTKTITVSSGGTLNVSAGTITLADDQIPVAKVNGAAKESSFAGIIFAADFGVVGDDLTDNTAAIQAALDSVPVSGAIVQLPAGIIRCSGTIYVNKSFVTLQGVNVGTRSEKFDAPGVGIGTKLLFTSAVDGIRVSPAQDAGATQRLGGVTLRDFGIAGTSVTNGCYGIRSQILSGNPDLSIYPVDDMLIERVAVTRYGTGIGLFGNDVTKIVNCWTTENGAGIYIYEGFYNQVTNTCIADNYVGAGIQMVDTLGGCITGNIIVRNKTNCLDFSGSTRDVSVTGNVIRNDTGNDGIVGFGYLLSLGSSSVRNTFTGNTFTALSGSGFLVNTAAIGNVFSGNQHDNFSPSYGAGVNWVDGWESVWTTPSLVNSWANFDSGVTGAAYRRSRTGRVQIQGIVSGGTLGATVFTLPLGYRPPLTQLFGTLSNNGAVDLLTRLVIVGDGTVRFENEGNTLAVLNCEFSIPEFTY